MRSCVELLETGLSVMTVMATHTRDRQLSVVAGSLRTLVMMRCPRISESMLATVGRRLPLLESLQLSDAHITSESLRTYPSNLIASSLREIVFQG